VLFEYSTDVYFGTDKGLSRARSAAGGRPHLPFSVTGDLATHSTRRQQSVHSCAQSRGQVGEW